jgi:hypothetical protein
LEQPGASMRAIGGPSNDGFFDNVCTNSNKSLCELTRAGR